jgi:DNA-binding winged helix-turn-helix (wHTH) protein
VTYCFGPHRLDRDRRLLFRGGGPVRLSPKAFELLLMLVEQSPRAVAKAELQDRLWPATFVAEANLANLIGEIREALGESGRGASCIRTVQRFGYAFEAEIRKEETADSAPPTVVCQLVRGRRRWPLPEGVSVVGRGADFAACFASPSVSREHAQITVAGARATVEDLGSKNGTFVGGVRVTAPRMLVNGDRLRLGSVTVTFAVNPLADPTQTLDGEGPLLRRQ